MRRWGLVLSIVTVILCEGSLVQAEKPTREEYEKLQQQIQDEKKNLAEIISKKASLLEHLEKLERQIAAAAREDQALRKKVSALETQIQETEKNLLSAQDGLAGSRKKVNARLRVLYRFGEVGVAQILFSARSLADLLDRQQMLSLVLKRDLSVLEAFNRELLQLRAMRDRLQEEKGALEKVRTEASQASLNFRQELRRKKTAFDVIGSEEALHRQYVKELEEASKEMENLLSDLAEKRKIWRTFYKARRFLRAKVNSMLRFVVVWYEGSVSSKTRSFFTYQFHKGVDVACQYGSLVKAIHPGKVVYSGWFKGFGQILIIDHGSGFYTVSARNQELLKQTGEEVFEGEPIARLSAVDEALERQKPMFYFEIREHGTSLDPMEWLSKNAFRQ